MKSVLISIRPEWCEKIASGEKTIEVKKTKPKCGAPFKCYIYCTKPKKRLSLNGGLFCFEDDLAILNRQWMPRIGNPWGSLGKGEMLINGKVIGEFICDRISEAHWMQDLGYACVYKTWQDNEDCMTNDELLEYMGEKDILYGWHISALKIYDEPKKLGHFIKPGYEEMETLEDTLCNYCYDTKFGTHKCSTSPITGYWFCEGTWCEKSYKEYLEEEFSLKRPPQSWCYVEEMG